MTFSVEPQTLPYSCENVPLKWCTDCWWLCTGAVNADPNYLGVGQVRAGAVIVAYNSGYPAAIHRWWTSGYRYILTYCMWKKIIKKTETRKMYLSCSLYLIPV